MGISDTYNGFANRNGASRRGFLVGALSLIAAPALVRASSIMPVKAWVEPAVTADPPPHSRTITAGGTDG
jgi:hypothetical protein